ncbi:MFS transporter [Rubrobacter marinus]|uniref:MFS transporter n=1 Tax=Rubrobacter marinus TaxID=2653852 RepID=A0A6G8Q0M8_9ACTN|nr:MFS transporter [Rubrobacter marinus]QIN80016.1 MFS transporter [Rubrobacter marinus]
MKRPFWRRGSISYGWIIVAISVLVVFLVSGARSAFTVFIAPMEGELGWDRATVSGVAALNLVVYGVTQPLAGTLTNRFGARAVMAGGTVLVAVGFGGLFWVPSVWYLAAFYGVLFGVGVSFASLIPTSVLVARWFERGQGMAQGIVTAARPAGQTIFVPVVAALILGFGWRESYLAVGVAMAVSLPLILWLVRETPPGAEGGTEEASPGATQEAFSLRSALGTFAFWALAVGFFVCGFTDQFVAIHLVPFAEGIGISSVTAANAFAVLSAAGVVGSIAAGWLSDISSRKGALAIIYGLRALSLPLLVLVVGSGDLVLLYLFALVFGFTFIANMAPTVGIVRARYGLLSTGVLVGWLLLTHQIGGAAGTYLGGLIYDGSGSYASAFALMAAAALVGALVSLGIREARIG